MIVLPYYVFSKHVMNMLNFHKSKTLHRNSQSGAIYKDVNIVPAVGLTRTVCSSKMYQEISTSLPLSHVQ